MKWYELALVLRTSLSEDNRKKVLETIKQSLKDLKVTQEEWGTKTFTYPIKKELSGFYVKFHIEGEVIPLGFEQKILAHADILRHLLLRKK